MVFNPVSCSGWESAGSGWIASGPCLKSRLGIVLLFFILALIRKWGGEEVGLSFSLFTSLFVGVVLYLLVVIISGNVLWAFLFGFIAGIIGGYAGGIFFGGSEY